MAIPSQVNPTHTAEISAKVALLSRFDSQIRIEFELINHRVGWLLFLNSFMFGAFAVAQNNPNKEGLHATLSQSLTIALPWIGLLSCIIVLFGVLAAQSVVSQLKRSRDQVEDQAKMTLDIPPIGIPETDWRHQVGRFPPPLMTILIGASWCYLLYAACCK